MRPKALQVFPTVFGSLFLNYRIYVRNQGMIGGIRQCIVLIQIIMAKINSQEPVAP